MNPRQNLSLMIVVVAVLLSGLAVLIAMTQDRTPGLRVRVGEQLRDIKQFDAELNLHVLRSKNDLDHNYDSLASLLDSLNKVQLSLDDLAHSAGEDLLKAPTQALKEALEEKTELVESFKTQNSVIRNSIRYLPQAARRLEDLSRQPGVSSGEMGAIRNETSHLVSDIWYFTQVADQVAEKRVQGTLDQLESLNAGRSGPLAVQVNLLVMHGRAIVEQSARMQELLVKISAVPTAQRTDELWQEFEKVFEDAAVVRDRWRIGLIVYSTILLVLLVVEGIKLIQSYRSLNLANTALKQANETLELRVKERTAGLSQALERLKESQLQLVQASKMASLGQMVAGIAHEINTPLAYINNSLQVASGRMTDINMLVTEVTEAMHLLSNDDTTEEALHDQFGRLDEITTAFVEMDAIQELETLMADGLHGIEHISEIITNLKNFSRLDRSRVDELDVNDGIRSTLKIARNVVKKHDVRMLLGKVPKIRCSPSQINQVLLNLITNACQATSEDRGHVFIITRGYKDSVRIDVVDDGGGIDPDTQDKIFDPFFTTKKVGEGTGLGLSIVYRIVAEHGGQISVKSRVGVGTKFSVLLPIDAPLTADETPTEAMA